MRPQPLNCINSPVDCIFRRGGRFLPTGSPGGGVQIPELSASPESAGAGAGAQNSAGNPDSEPPAPREPIFFCRMRPMAPAFRPKSSMQVPPDAENSQKCTPLSTLGTRSKKTNSLGEYVNEGPSAPARRFRLATFDGVKGGAKSKYVGRGRRARWDGFRPRLFVAEADAQRLGLAHQIALGVDVLELAGDLLERHVAHLAVTQGNHVAKLAA